MALQSSGAISLNNVNVELGNAGTTTITLNDAAVRTLAGIASGQISFSDFYGKSFVVDAYIRYASSLLHFEGAQNYRSVFVDSSPSNNTITNSFGSGDSVYASADSPYNSRGVAYKFHGMATPVGTTAGASVDDHVSLQFGTGAFTVEFWIKVQDISFGTYAVTSSSSFLRKNLTGNPYAAGTGSNSSANWSFNLYDSGQSTQTGFGNLALLIGGTYNQYSTMPTAYPAETARAPIADGSWHHVAWIRDSSGYSTLFLDGKVYANLDLALSGVSLGDPNVTNPGNINKLYIGGYGLQVGNDPLMGFPQTGNLSNLRIVKGSAVYTHNTPFTVPTSPLTAISGTSLLMFHTTRCVDGSSNNHTVFLAQPTSSASPAAKLVGNGPFGISAEVDPSTSVGSICINQMLAHNVNTGYLYSTITPIGTNDFTFEFWVKSAISSLNNSGDVVALISLGTTYADAAGISIYAINNARLKVNVSNLDFAINLFQDGSGGGNDNCAARVWNHIAITRSSNAVQVYKNGVSVGNGTVSTNLTATTLTIFAGNSSGTARWGKTANSYPATKISDLRIVSGTAVYTGASSFTPPASPLSTISGTVFHCKAQPSSYYSKTGTPTGDPIAFMDYASGLPTLSSAYSKFNTKSLYITGNSGLTWDDPVFDNGVNYTVEFWARFPTLGASSGSSGNNIGYIWSTVGANGGLGRMNLCMMPDGRLLLIAGGTTVYSYNQASAYLYLSTNTWYHIAISRFGNQYRVFVDGYVWIATGEGGTNLYPSEADYGSSYVNFMPLRGAFLGAMSAQIQPNTVSANMYVDELRITAGYVRYWNSNFTAPTTKFLDVGTPKAQPPAGGQALYLSPVIGVTNTYSFVVPTGVTTISAFVVGGGGGGGTSGVGGGSGGGGGAAYGTIPVTPGETLTIEVGHAGNSAPPRSDGGNSRILRGGTPILTGYGGSLPAAGGYYIDVYAVNYPTYGGGVGGSGLVSGSFASGGGAGGYTGPGGSGTNGQSAPGGDSSYNSGGGRGGTGGTYYTTSEGLGGNLNCTLNTEVYAGGSSGYGVGPYGLHLNSSYGYSGGPGSGQVYFPSSDVRGWWTNGNPYQPVSNYLYGGGGGGMSSVYSNNAYEYYDEAQQQFFCGEDPGTTLSYHYPTPGAVRIIWGPNRAYPSTNTHDIVTT